MGNMIHLPLASLATINDEEDSLRDWVRYQLRPVFAHQCCVLSIAMPGKTAWKSRLVGWIFRRRRCVRLSAPAVALIRRWCAAGCSSKRRSCLMRSAVGRHLRGVAGQVPLLPDAQHGGAWRLRRGQRLHLLFQLSECAGHQRAGTGATLLALQQPLAAALRRLLRPADATHSDPDTLTEREQQIAYWVGQGKSNWEIAAILGISESTTKTHVANLLRKLGLASRAALKQQHQALPAGSLPAEINVAFMQSAGGVLDWLDV